MADFGYRFPSHRAYEEALANNNALDFDDLLVRG